MVSIKHHEKKLQAISSNKNIYVVFYIVLILIFAPLVLLATESISEATAYNGDIIGYVESLKKIYYGLYVGDLEYALNINTYGYGAGMFIILAVITLPIQYIFGGDQFLLIVLRSIGLISFILATLIIKKILENLLSKRDIKIEFTWLIIVMTLSIYPATSLLITRVHPEMMQFLFILLGIYCDLKFEDNEEVKYLILSAIMWGIAVGIKISGGLFLVIPFYFIISNGYIANKEKLKKLLIWGSICLTVGILTICPYVVISIQEGSTHFFNELNAFMPTLQTMSYSDFDNYQQLTSKWEVFRGWFTYVYRHGFSGILWIIAIFLSTIFAIVTKKGDSKINRLNIGIMIAFIINVIYYVLKVTRISVNYYYIPICLLTIIFLITIFGEMSLRKNLCFVLCFIFVISIVPSLEHDVNIYKEQVELGKRLNRQSYRYENFRKWLKERHYPYRSIMLPTTMNLGLASDDLNWIPNINNITEDKRSMLAVEGGITEKISYYWLFSEIWDTNPTSILSTDVVVIDKLGDANFANVKKILEQNGFTQIYNDNFVSAYGGIAPSLSDNNLNEYINHYIEENMLEIIFSGGWNGIVIPFEEKKDCIEYEKIAISFNLKNVEDVQEIRVVFNGVCNYANENAWHFVITKDKLKEGNNTILIGKEEFTLQQGYIDWENITSIGFGGVGDSAKISDIQVELKK